MAEAVVEDRPQQPQRRFYCHECSVEIEMVANEFTCPLCAGGFVEELPAPIERNNDLDIEMVETNPRETFPAYEGLSSRLTDELSTLFMSVAGERAPSEEDDNAQNPSGSNGSGRRRVRRRIGGVGNFNYFDNMLHDLLISVTTGAGAGGGGTGGTPMFFMGNPGDYAWGREGLDTIVTQLLNQMETTGPPPLPKDQIQEIPKVEVTQDQVDIKLQCSVCWEDFLLKEIVRKLSCSHVYHENCIVPWLELHGTCPVCRKSFVPDLTEEQQRAQFSTVAANSIRNVTAFIRNGANDSNSTNNENLQSSQQQNIPHPPTSIFVGAFSPYTQQAPHNSQPSNNSHSTLTSPQPQQHNQNNTSNQPNNGRRNNNSDRDDDGIVEYEFD